MRKKVLFVDCSQTEKYPPLISVLNVLSELVDIEVHVCALSPSNYLKVFCKENNILLHNVKGTRLYDKSRKMGFISRLYHVVNNRKSLWKIINNLYTNDDLIWVSSFMTLRQLGRKLIGKRYIIHFLELMKESRLYYKLPYPKVDLKKYIINAQTVIECEYNRAHILKAWFDLPKLPVVLPNKLYIKDTDILNNYHNEEIERKLKSVEGKKIILYQGILGKERPIDTFVEAVGELGTDYAMIIMSQDKYTCKVYPDNLCLVGYIPAPYHLHVTKHAYIGILVYQADRNGHAQNDCLNSIYCAPNKIFEYAKYGLPMVGNDIPGLQNSIVQNNMGVCVEEMTKEQIKEAIFYIEKNYKEMRENAFAFYNSVNIKTIVKKIFE